MHHNMLEPLFADYELEQIGQYVGLDNFNLNSVGMWIRLILSKLAVLQRSVASSQ